MTTTRTSGGAKIERRERKGERGGSPVSFPVRLDTSSCFSSFSSSLSSEEPVEPVESVESVQQMLFPPVGRSSLLPLSRPPLPPLPLPRPLPPSELSFSLFDCTVMERIVIGVCTSILSAPFDAWHYSFSRGSYGSYGSYGRSTTEDTFIRNMDEAAGEIVRIFSRRGRTWGAFASYLSYLHYDEQHHRRRVLLHASEKDDAKDTCYHDDVGRRTTELRLRVYENRIAIGIALVELFVQTNETHLALQYADVLVDSIMNGDYLCAPPTSVDLPLLLLPIFPPLSRMCTQEDYDNETLMCLIVRQWQKRISESALENRSRFVLLDSRNSPSP